MNSDSPISTCPKCQAPIPEGAPRGLCPRCLMGQALDSEPKVILPAPPIADLAPHFPQLEILELLGAGGMGRVYKARQIHLDRLVALKVLPPELASDPSFAERFTREARALAKLNHPNIVQVFDFGQSAERRQGSPYFYLLLEYVDGVNLRQAMRAGTLTSREALGIVPRLCDALQYAHEHGVLHRDIKPENILLDAQGRVKIADFGLARFQGGGDTAAMTLTASGARLGTAAYMAPEQIERPHDVDHRADIYSLGVVFYEMLTGELPLGRFAAPSETSGVDPRLDSVVFRTLEKERERRYQNAGEMRTQVEGIAGTPTPKSAAAAFSSPVAPTSALKESHSAYAFPPEAMQGLWAWQCRKVSQRRGRLILEPDKLTYGTRKATLSIPLDSVEELALAPLAFGVEPLGRCSISLRWRDATGNLQTTCLLPKLAPMEKAAVEFAATDEWLASLREAVTKHKGREPSCPHSVEMTAASVTPPPPNYGRTRWLLLALAAFILAMMGFAMFFLPGVAVVFAASYVALGLWRRAREPAPAASDAAFRSANAPPLANDLAAAPAGPRLSKLALGAFALATIGWVVPFVGPIIGCVLGWIALGQINRSGGLLKGRGFALFAALEAPLLAGNALLIAGTFGLLEAELMPLAYVPIILAVAALAFLYNSFVFCLAGFRALPAWRKLAAAATGVLAVVILAASAWLIMDLRNKYPLRGTKTYANFETRLLNGEVGAELASALESGPYGEFIQASSEGRRVRVEFVVGPRHEADRLLHDIEREVAEKMPPKLQATLSSSYSRTGPLFFVHPSRRVESISFLLAVVGCCVGFLLSLSGFSFGLLGILLGAVACFSLQDARLPSPFGEKVHEKISIGQPGPVNEVERAPSFAVPQPVM